MATTQGLVVFLLSYYALKLIQTSIEEEIV